MAVGYFTLLDVSLVFLALFILRCLLRPRPLVSLPPGPKGLPIIGNVLDMPSEKDWLTFAHWGDIYGTLFSFAAFALVALNLLI